MAVTITNPVSTFALVSVNQPVLFEATLTSPDTAANMQWSASINGGAFTVFASGVSSATYLTPSSVANVDGSGNAVVDTIAIQAKNTSTLNSATYNYLVLVQGIPAVQPTTVGAAVGGAGGGATRTDMATKLLGLPDILPKPAELVPSVPYSPSVGGVTELAQSSPAAGQSPSDVSNASPDGTAATDTTGTPSTQSSPISNTQNTCT